MAAFDHSATGRGGSPFGGPPPDHRRRWPDDPPAPAIFPPAGEAVPAAALVREAPPRPVGSLTGSDPPDHTRLRRLVAGSFTPSRIEELRPRAIRLANDLIDRLGTPPADFVEAFAAPFSAHLLLDVLGTPENGREEAVRHFDGFLFAGSLTLAERMSRAGELNRHVIALLMRARSARPAGGLVGALADAREEGRLTEEELHGLIHAIVTVGHSTAVATMTGAVRTLLRRPGRLARLAKSPSGVPSAVEELLRSDVHRPADPRTAAGHHALSAGLARMQLQVMVRQLAERVPTLRPAGKPLHTDGGATRRLTSLPVTFHALRRTG